MSDNKHKPHIVSYVQNLWVWIVLLLLTFLTVAIAGVDFKELAVVVALTIASVKSIIVASYFMHLRFDNKIITIMSIVVLFVFTVFIALTMVDYLTR